MSVQQDGQAKCDKCGALDGNTGIELTPGWVRREIPATNSIHPDYQHFCPGCAESGGG